MMNKKHLLLLIIVSCCLLSACATQIPVHLVKPADNGQTIAALEVKPFVTSPYFQQYGVELAHRIKAGVSQAGFIKVVEGRGYPRLEGTLSMFPPSEQCAPAEYKDWKGHNHQGYSCTRQITMSASYTISNTGHVVANQFSADQEDFDFGSSPAAILSTLKPPQQLFYEGIDVIVQHIVEDISPRQVKEYWALQKGQHPKFKQGIKQIKNKQENEALISFSKVTLESEQPSEQAAAYYNSAVLRMKRQDIPQAFRFATIAEHLMPGKQLYTDTLNTIQHHLQTTGKTVPDKARIIAEFAAGQSPDDEKQPEIVDISQAKKSTFYQDYQHYAEIQLTGRLIDDSPIKAFNANGFALNTDKQGYFDAQVDVLLDEDAQGKITLSAEDIHGNYAEKTVVISISEIFPRVDDSIDPLLSKANYHALIIGIDDYKHLDSDLDTAVNDAKTLQHILQKNYGFSVTTLLNQQATRDAIINALYSYRNLTPQDQLLIFYAGHGIYDETQNTYYWLATDAGAEEDANWIDTRRVSNVIKSNPATNILLVIDSCYAGTFRTPIPAKYYATLQEAFSRPSRIFIASAGKEPADGGYINSVFAKPFIKGLQEINKPRFTSAELYHTYLSGKIAQQMTKHEHFTQDSEGDFVFQRKR